MIRNVKITDAQEIMEIYNYYITNTHVTFEEEPLTLTEMENRIKETTVNFPWIVYVDKNKVLGYAYASRWRTRSAYKHTAESTVYLHHDSTGRGIGTALYSNLLNSIKEAGYHAVMGSLGLPNDKSAGLHQKFGYVKVAHMKEVGYKFGKWIDVGYWELLLTKEIDHTAQ